ncbi:Pectinesterase, catalytic [Dillenia turbinata]|uniref:Pectinesterase, catalytic n=1 Tax=Dillenia turbinata TaxID=194707 RepID=A0AAN8UIM0_9MAGN
MDSVKSFRGYGKVDPVEDQAFRRKTRRRLIVLIVSVIVLLAIVVGAVVGTLANKKSSSANSSAPATLSQSLKSVCSVTQYPDSCFSSISSVESSSSTTKDPEEIFKLSLLVAANEITKLISLPTQIISEFNISDERVKAALSDCKTLFDYALYHLNDSISSTLSASNIDDIQTWLSSVITYQETCLDGLREINAATVEEAMQSSMQNSTEYSSNSLAIVTNIFTILESFNIPIHRRKLLSTLDHRAEFPKWMHAADRRLLQETNPTPNLTVAQDGSGNYKTITEAVAAVPQQNKRRFVIYVKACTYVEKVTIGVNVWNLMMYGDGMTSTIVSGSLSNGDNSTTFNSASFGNLSFENSFCRVDFL